MKHSALFAAAVIVPLNVAAPAAEAQDARKPGIDLTIYTNGLALIDETRTLRPSGSARIRLDDVGPRMVTDSLIFTPDGDVSVREISLDSDVLSQQALLKRALGKAVRVARTNPATGVETIEEAVVLSVENGLVLKIGDRIETSVPGRLIFDEVPSDLSAAPALSVRLDKPLSKDTPARLAYLSDGLSWDATYTVVLTPKLTKLDLDGWARITNNAGVDLGPAQLSLVAGSVNRERMPMQGKILMRAEAMSVAADGAAPPAPTELSAFHMYRMPDVVTLKDRETKRLSLLSASDVAAKRVLEFRTGAPVYGVMRGIAAPVHAVQRVTLVNDAASGLGQPLPAGIVRAYVPDESGALRFVGEDRIGNVPIGEDVGLDLGSAFDVTMTRKQTGFRQLGDRTVEVDFTLALKNGGTGAADVKVVEDIAGDWEILKQSEQHARDGLSAVWNVSVPAKKTVDLVYSVRVRR